MKYNIDDEVISMYKDYCNLSGKSVLEANIDFIRSDPKYFRMKLEILILQEEERILLEI
jgi:hypothetical protein